MSVKPANKKVESPRPVEVSELAKREGITHAAAAHQITLAKRKAAAKSRDTIPPTKKEQ